MAINLDDRYPGRANGKTLSYPQGSFKNRTSPTAKDGTYLEQDWANDQLAFFQSLIKQSGMTANGIVDAVGASQYFDALMGIVGAATPNATELVRGLIAIATTAQAQALTDDAAALTSKKLADAFKGGNQSLGGNGYQKLPGGLIVQWGATSTNASGQAIFTFPIAFPNALYRAVVNPIGGNFTVGLQNSAGLSAINHTIVQANTNAAAGAGNTVGFVVFGS